jgi:DNA-binding regulatory protein, YebC/PmpR family
MGRAFEFRKARKFKRWGNMARTFTRLGREIEMAVKEGGGDPSGNARLRLLIQNAKTENMPKENVERAIKRAISKDTAGYKDMIYEGYAPHGIALVIETATDNPNRTVANIRACFTKLGGSLGTSGMSTFLFERKCNFKVVNKEGTNLEDLEFELIDLGVDELFLDDDNLINVYAPFENFGPIQKWLEDNSFEIKNFSFERIPNELRDLPEDQQEEVNKLIERLEEDDDVTNVFNNMA